MNIFHARYIRMTMMHDDINSSTSSSDKFMVYSYQAKKPNLSVYDNRTQVASSGNTVIFDSTQNTLTVNVANASNISANEKIRIAGEFLAADSVAKTHLNGREFTVTSVTGNTVTHAGITWTGGSGPTTQLNSSNPGPSNPSQVNRGNPNAPATQQSPKSWNIASGFYQNVTTTPGQVAGAGGRGFGFDGSSVINAATTAVGVTANSR